MIASSPARDMKQQSQDEQDSHRVDGSCADLVEVHGDYPPSANRQTLLLSHHGYLALSSRGEG